MDIGRAIQYVFRDPNWIVKILIGGIMLIIPVIGWMIAAGYYLRTVQGVVMGADTPLPEWNDWGGDIVRGLKVIVVAIIWLIPVWLLACLTAIVTGFDDTGAAGLLFNCLIFLVSLVFTFLFPVIIGRLAKQEQLGDAFQVGDIIQEATQIPSQLLIYVVLSYVVAFVAWIGIIACFVGIFFTWFISYLITGHLVGQIRRMLDGAGPLPAAETAPPPPAA